MKLRDGLRISVSLAAMAVLGMLVAGCGGSTDAVSVAAPVPWNAPASTPAIQGTGVLTVSVTDTEGVPLSDAHITVYDRTRTAIVGSASTGTNGLATIGSVPAEALVYVGHAFGAVYRSEMLDVAQEGVTLVHVTMNSARPGPTVALLPVSIPVDSISADRSELTLQLSVVASASASFLPASWGDNSPDSTPSLSLNVGQAEAASARGTCMVWLDRSRVVPSCDPPASTASLTVSVLQFDYDAAGHAPLLVAETPVASTLLLMDQSARMSELDPNGRRFFAARQLVARVVDAASPSSLSVAGFAADSSGALSPALLPQQPLWSPLGAGTAYSSERDVLNSAIGSLEPLVGGAAPVFDALGAALTSMTADAPLGNRAMVALLGGDDESQLTDAARATALASLRQQRIDSGILPILIFNAPSSLDDSFGGLAMAELAAALDAPYVSLGIEQSWTSGAYGALDLAADLADGLPLPTLTAAFRVTTSQPDGFLAGTTLYGAVYVESDLCPMGCAEFPLPFAVRIP